MTKLRITLLASIILALATITHANPCGQQHAERCLTETSPQKTAITKADVKTILVTSFLNVFKLRIF